MVVLAVVILVMVETLAVIQAALRVAAVVPIQVVARIRLAVQVEALAAQAMVMVQAKGLDRD